MKKKAKQNEAIKQFVARPQYRDLVLFVDMFCASVESGMIPMIGSPCHRMMRNMVDESGCRPVRRRMRLPAEKGMK